MCGPNTRIRGNKYKVYTGRVWNNKERDPAEEDVSTFKQGWTEEEEGKICALKCG